MMSMTIGEKINAIRNSRCLKQSEFAQSLNVSQTHISKIEGDIVKPSADLLKLISEIYGIKYDILTNENIPYAYFVSIIPAVQSEEISRACMSDFINKRIWLVFPNDKSGFSMEEVKVVEINEDEFVYIPYYDGKQYRNSFEDCGFFRTKEAALRGVQLAINSISLMEEPTSVISIYRGSITTNLSKLDNDIFEWNIVEEFRGEVIKTISLSEIYKQAVMNKYIKEHEMLTVFYTTPLKGKIYEVNNYQEGDWHLIGSTHGYA